ncbi:MAG: DNA polymerase III subunit gamma/tau, partial [Verrucomicrobiia bacterium]
SYHVIRTLANAIERNRLAHAYLFVGPRGTGKTSTARILAKGLNCAEGPTISPCGQCAACVEITRGSSLDVIEIDGASNNGVEQVRDLRESARFSPARDRFKIYIIDEVHMLSTAAFNALLKTLEEPPAHVKFFFATTEVHKVLPTILSRCQRFDLRRIPTPKIADHLALIASKEKITLEPAAAQAIARGADGGMRDAESMLDQLVAFCGETITEEDVLGVFGFASREAVTDLCGKILARDTSGSLACLAEHEDAGRDLSRLVTDLIAHLRNLLVIAVNPSAQLEDLDEEALTTLREQAALVSSDRLLELVSQFADVETRMRWAQNKRLHCEVGIIRAIQFLGEMTLTEVLARFADDSPEVSTPRPAPPQGAAPTSANSKTFAAPALPEMAPGKPPAQRTAAPPAGQTGLPQDETASQGTQDVPSPKQTAVRSQTVAEPTEGRPPSFSSLKDLWERTVKIARARRPLVTSWIASGQPLSVSGQGVVVGFSIEDRSAYEALKKPNFLEFLNECLTTAAECPLKARLELREDLLPTKKPSTAPETDSPTAAHQDPLFAEFENDPKIERVLARFEGRLKQITPAS